MPINLLDLIPAKVKAAISIGTLILILILSGIVYYQANRIESLKVELVTCQVERKQDRIIFEEERIKATNYINDQNDKITQFEVNLSSVSKAVNHKEKALIEARATAQQQVDKELTTDSSSDNQLRIINRIMKEFANETN